MRHSDTLSLLAPSVSYRHRCGDALVIHENDKFLPQCHKASTPTLETEIAHLSCRPKCNIIKFNHRPGSTLVYSSFVPSHSVEPTHQPYSQTSTHSNQKLTSTHFPTHGFTAAQINNPDVAKMKTKTTASSFLESLSKPHTHH